MRSLVLFRAVLLLSASGPLESIEASGWRWKVFVDVAGKKMPSLRAVDLSLAAGRVGVGSFFAQFRNLKAQGTPVGAPAR